MLKFIRGKGQQPSIERHRQQKELLAFKKTVQHGFPNKPTALAWDPELRLLAIGTASGAIKVLGKPGVEFYGQHESAETSSVSRIVFLPGQGRLVSMLDDNSLILWEITESKPSTLRQLKTLALEGKLKRISAICLESGGRHLLLGTEGGNVYLLNTVSFQMEENIIYQDVVMQNVPEDYKINPGAVEALQEMPGHPNKLLIGYYRGLMVLWDREALRAEQTFVSTQQLEGVSWHASGTKFRSAHNDGSLVIWDAQAGGRTPLEEPTTVYGPFPCRAISKVCWHQSKGEDLVVFGGGMPRASHSERHTVTVMKGERHVVFDFTSRVIDFITIMPEDESLSDAGPEALIVLAEEEMIALDLWDAGWRMLPLPYLVSLHASAVTCLQLVSPVPKPLWEHLKQAGKVQEGTMYSDRAWPVNGGECEEPDEAHADSQELLLTGHEDGSVRFWAAGGVALTPLFKFNSEPIFSTGEEREDGDEDGGDEDDWPPFRKVGCFDPYSDDPRLAVKKVSLCPLTGTLVVAGTAGHLIVAKLAAQPEGTSTDVKVCTLNIVSDRDGFVWKGHDQLKPKTEGKAGQQQGAWVEAVVQLHPPASITALAVHSTWGVLAAGTAHGLAVYDIKKHKAVTTRCTLNPNDLSGAGDTPISRRKSFKKSLRESFRRLRKGRSQRNTNKAGTSTPSPAGAEKKPEIAGSSATSPGTSVALSRPVERQVEARPTEDALGSMVRCLALEQTFLVNQQVTTPTLWAGTNSGNVLVFTVTVPGGSKRKEEDVSCQLGKEIQLKHRAPVVHVLVLDGIGAPLPLPGEVEAGLAPSPDISGPHRVVICSEEQFKTFTLPTLKPFCKSKLTAHEGSMLRRAAAIRLTGTGLDEAQFALLGLTNMGEILTLSLPELRRLTNAPCTRREDINGISSLCFSRHGEAIYMMSSSELQRASVGTRRVTQALCWLPQTHAPAPEETEEPRVNGDAGSDAGSKKDEAEGDVSLTTSAGTEEQLELSVGEITLDSVKDHISTEVSESSSRTVEVVTTTVITTTNVAVQVDGKSDAATATKNGPNGQAEQQLFSLLPTESSPRPASRGATVVPDSATHNETSVIDGKAPLATSEDL